MDKKFLSAEEAIAHFGLDPVEFQHMVDEGEVRALADRGTWKYRRDEIEGLIQEGLLKAQPPTEDAQEQTLEFESPPTDAGPEDLSFIELDEDALAEGATMIQKQADFDFRDEAATPGELFAPTENESAARPPLADSVSDVRISPESLEDFGSGIEAAADSSEEIEISDSDFEISAPTEDLPVAESLSEFELQTTSDKASGEESSVIVGRAEEEHPESDSDVKVVASQTADSDSDVALVGETDASGVLMSEESSGSAASDSDVQIADSGISLEPGPDSGISLESSSVVGAGDSAFLKGDSGISLDAGDSGISLDAGDSGISLHSAAESGISLEAGDSGISLGGADSGIRLDEQTGRPKKPRLPAETEVEMESFDSDEFAAGPDDSGLDQTATLGLDDDDSASQATLPPTKGKKAAGLSETFDVADEVEDLDIIEDLDAGELDVDAVEDEDEAIEDILEASDEVFLDGESSEMMSDEGVASVSSMRSAVATGPREPSWGIWAVLPVAACALLLAMNGLILWEGVATMWTGDTPTISGSLVDSLGGQ